MSKFEEGLKEYQRRVKAGEIERTKSKTPEEKWEANKTNRKLAINAFCWMCIGESVKEIRECTSYKCQLWYVRPYQKKQVIGMKETK